MKEREAGRSSSTSTTHFTEGPEPPLSRHLTVTPARSPVIDSRKEITSPRCTSYSLNRVEGVKQRGLSDELRDVVGAWVRRLDRGHDGEPVVMWDSGCGGVDWVWQGFRTVITLCRGTMSIVFCCCADDVRGSLRKVMGSICA